MGFFIRTLIGNIATVFSPRYLRWHVLAILATLVLVYAGLDWQYFLAARSIYPYFFWTAVVGGLVPLFVPLVLLLLGYVQKRIEVIKSGWLFLHAVTLGSVTSSIYKTFTGRMQPDLHNYTLDISHHFQLGFFRHGIFWGWPSSHTTIAFSMAFAFLYRYPKHRFAAALWLVYAFLIGLGVSMSIHWLSDAVAGMLIGSVCGRVAARSRA